MSNRPNRKPSTATARRVTPRPSRKEQPSRAPWIIGFGVLLVVALVAIAIFATRLKDSTISSPGVNTTIVQKSELVYGEPSVQGSPLPQLPESGGPDPAVGMKAPIATSQQFDGNKITLPTEGTPAVVMFVAHWCPHCQKEVPLLAGYLGEAGRPSGVDLFAVSTAAAEDKPNFSPSAWLNREKWPVRTIADDKNQQIANAYGLSGFPYFVVVDAKGNVVARASGELSVEQFQSLLDQARSAAPSGTAPAPATAVAPGTTG